MTCKGLIMNLLIENGECFAPNQPVSTRLRKCRLPIKIFDRFSRERHSYDSVVRSGNES